MLTFLSVCLHVLRHRRRRRWRTRRRWHGDILRPFSLSSSSCCSSFSFRLPRARSIAVCFSAFIAIPIRAPVSISTVWHGPYGRSSESREHRSRCELRQLCVGGCTIICDFRGRHDTPREQRALTFLHSCTSSSIIELSDHHMRVSSSLSLQLTLVSHCRRRRRHRSRRRRCRSSSSSSSSPSSPSSRRNDWRYTSSSHHCTAHTLTTTTRTHRTTTTRPAPHHHLFLLLFSFSLSLSRSLSRPRSASLYPNRPPLSVPYKSRSLLLDFETLCLHVQSKTSREKS